MHIAITETKGNERFIVSPTRPVKRPINNSVVEYATFSEIIRNSLFIYLCPDRMFPKTENKKDEKETFSGGNL